MSKLIKVNISTFGTGQEPVKEGAKREFKKPVKGAVSIKAVFYLDKKKKKDCDHIALPTVNFLGMIITSCLLGIVYRKIEQVNNLLVCKDYDFDRPEGVEIEIMYRGEE